MDSKNINAVLIPDLRLKEFKDASVAKKLDSTASFSREKNISKSDISDDGLFECIRYGGTGIIG